MVYAEDFTGKNALDMSLSSTAPEKDGDPLTQLERPTTPTEWSPSVKADRGSSPASPAESAQSRAPSDADKEDELAADAQMSSPAGAGPMQIDECDPPDVTLVHPDEQRRQKLSQAEVEGNDGTQNSNRISYISAPTPAQRPKPLPPSSGAGTMQSPAAPSNETRRASVIDSSPLNSQRAAKGRRADDSYLASHEMSGPGKILVPNSDTSGTVSQTSQSQTKRNRWVLRSQSQSQSQSSDPSQNQLPSQEKETDSQEQPIAQSLSYTSQEQSQSQGKQQAQLEVVAEEPAAEVQPKEDGVDVQHIRPAETLEDDAAVSELQGIEPMDIAVAPSAPELEDEAVDDSAQPEPTTAAGAKAEETSGESEVEEELDRFGADVADVEEEGNGVEVDVEEFEGFEAGVEETDDEHELDSDDARTYAALRASGSGETKVDEEPPATASSSSGRIAQQPPLHHSSSLQNVRTPVVPASPDVFMSEASFSAHTHSSPRGRKSSAFKIPHGLGTPPSSRRVSKAPSLQFNAVAGPSRVAGDTVKVAKTARLQPQLTERHLWHDAEAWNAPSFQRTRSGQMIQRPTVAQTDDGRKALKRKRSVDNSKMITPQSKQERRPAKKAKRDAAPSPEHRKPLTEKSVFPIGKQQISTTKAQQGTAPSAVELAKTDSLASTTSRIRELDLRRYSSASSSSSARAKKSRQSSTAMPAGGSTTIRTNSARRAPKEAAESREGQGKDAVPVAVVRRRLKLGGYKLNLTLNPKPYPSHAIWQTVGALLSAAQKLRKA